MAMHSQNGLKVLGKAFIMNSKIRILKFEKLAVKLKKGIESMNQKRRIPIKTSNRTIITWFIVFLWMGIIFSFSSRPATDSNEQSYTVGRLICGVVIPGFKEMPETEKLVYLENINFGVRKTAHVTEYAILGILLAIAMNNKRIPVSLAIGILYACTDEFHQLFVAGRSGQIRDVMIDSAGVLLGILMVAVLFRRKQGSITTF